MLLVTWNVLHRTHAENRREAVPDRCPGEADRIRRVTAFARDALPTRPRADTAKSAVIDHVFVRSLAAGVAQVPDAGGLSDHNLVTCDVR